MKKSLIGIGVITSIILTGCGNQQPQINYEKIAPKSVSGMMGNSEVVGWENYRDDDDGDRVPNYKDQCPNTPAGAEVDEHGCLLDLDQDGVPDYLDQCPNTPIGVAVNSQGCSLDDDKDGVTNENDKCPNTPFGVEVDKYGCALDRDKDGVADYEDKCKNTPAGAEVDESGCSLDDDNDGVPNGLDECLNTPNGAKVDKKGCAIDSDKDGVIDLKDKCPNTAKGIKVGEDGCALDSDNDGIPDYEDKCPNTPENIKVNFQGCPVIAEFRFNFKFNSAKIDKKFYPQIEALSKVLKNNPKINIEVQGFTDNKGSYLYNKELSLKRANALREILIKKFKISPNRITIIGYGSDYPIASNSTKEGQALNRRIVVVSPNGGLIMNSNNSTQNSDENEENYIENEDNIDR